MPTLPQAVDVYLSVLASAHALDDLRTAGGEVARRIPAAPPADRDAALRALRNAVLAGHLVPTAVTAALCGALVEAGGDPLAAGPALLQRLPEVLDGAAAYWAAARAKAAADGAPDADPDELAGRYTDAVYREDRPAVWAFMAQRGVSAAAVAHLARSRELRAAVRAEGGFLEKSEAADRAEGRPGPLTAVLRVLDGEPLVVLDPAGGRGYRVVVSGVADNFQLHTLLADALADWTPSGTRPDPRTVAAATDGPADPTAPPAGAAFDLWQWTALRPDGTLPDDFGSDDDRPADAGSPADLLAFDGGRVVLVGPPAVPRSWAAGRRFGGMAGELAVERPLTPDEARDWLARIASAPRA